MRGEVTPRRHFASAMHRSRRRASEREARKRPGASRRANADDGVVDVVANASTSSGSEDAGGDDAVVSARVIERARREGAVTKEGKTPPRRTSKKASAAASEGSFLSKISWAHIFFLALFTLPTAFMVVDYLFGITPPDGQAYGTLTPEGKFYREKINAFYSEYNPEKLKSVDGLLMKHRGKERALYNTIRRKYKMAGAKRVDQRYDED